MKKRGLFALPALLAGVSAGLYLLQLQRARRRTRPDPAALVQADPRDFEAALRLEGVPNARDLGGYRTMDGLRVRRGMIYRSGELSNATDHDLERLQALDVRLILDLREPDEAAAAPDRLPEGADYALLPFTVPVKSARLVSDLVLNLHQLDRLMQRTYTGIALESGAANLGVVLRRLAQDDRALPVLIHCTAGKDRTGFAAALLLALLGVPDDVILADYSLSNRDHSVFAESVAWQARSLRRIGIAGDDLHALTLANPATLQATLHMLRARFGTLDEYLHVMADVDEITLRRLRKKLLEPDND
jgi:protein-tyrosine phosphatase